jgi:threonine/homoserine/homoserine lactone efflux protein
MLLLLKGCFIGLAIAAPVGPVGVICIRRSLAQGAKYGLGERILEAGRIYDIYT